MKLIGRHSLPFERTPREKLSVLEVITKAPPPTETVVCVGIVCVRSEPEKECIVELPHTSRPILGEDGADAIIRAWELEGVDTHFQKLAKLGKTTGYHGGVDDFQRERRRTHELCAKLGITLR